jgi:hypothetical protein
MKALLLAIVFLSDCCLADPLATWNLVFSNTPAPITSMAYGNGTFIAVGNGYQFTSNNGSNWTVSETAPIINSGGIAFDNGMFLQFGTNIQNRANYILESTNGATWSAIYTNSNTLISAAYGNNTWVFVGTNNIVTATVTSSNWIWTAFQPTFQPTSVYYGNGQFLIDATLDVWDYAIFSSADGITWQYISTLPYVGATILQATLTGIAYGNGVYVVSASYANGDYLLASDNLLQWTSVIGPNGLWNYLPVTFGGNEFAVCSGGQIYTSSNGYAWALRVGANVKAIAYGQGTFVACNSNIWQSGVFAAPSNPPPANLSISVYPGVTITGTPGLPYQIQYTTNLSSSWLTLTAFTLPYSPYIWVDTSSPILGQRLYRSIQIQ